MPTCKNCNNRFPHTVVIDGVPRKISKRSFCLVCSPFQQPQLRVPELQPKQERRCPACQQTKPPAQFNLRNRATGRLSPYCVECSAIAAIIRQMRFKIACVQYLGGECVVCGERSVLLLDCHHKEPGNKQFGLSTARSRAFDDKIKTELDKCELLCVKCHRLHHSKYGILVDFLLTEDSVGAPGIRMARQLLQLSVPAHSEDKKPMIGIEPI